MEIYKKNNGFIIKTSTNSWRWCFLDDIIYEHYNKFGWERRPWDTRFKHPILKRKEAQNANN